MSSPAALAEFEARKSREAKKALDKYGQDALIPEGRPDLDVLDYAINEMVGFVRYADMLESRHRKMLSLMQGMKPKTYDTIREGIPLARELRAFASRYAIDMIDLWQRLKKEGLALGLTEGAAP